MIVGKISSTSAQPYYSGLKSFGPFIPFPVGGSVLPDLILRGKVTAGPVNMHEAMRLMQLGCTPLSDFGMFMNPYVVNKIDVRGAAWARAALLHAPYVLLARKPIETCENLDIGVASEISSGASDAMILAKTLLSFMWEIPHTLNSEVAMEDDAWLVPGGPYLQVNSSAFFGFPYAYDLSWEWYRWQKTPYIFQRRICGPDVDETDKEELIVSLRRTLENNLRNMPILASNEAGARGLERTEVLTYLQAFGYRLGLWQRSSESSANKLLSLLKDAEIEPLEHPSA